MSERTYLQHGPRHSGQGSDAPAADWYYIEDQATAWNSGTTYAVDDVVSHGKANWICVDGHTNKEPGVAADAWKYWTFQAPYWQNGFSNVGGSKQPLAFAFLPARDSLTDEPLIELVGSVTGGSLGDTIFTLPVTRAYDRHRPATDDGGGYVPFTVKQNGDVVYGFV